MVTTGKEVKDKAILWFTYWISCMTTWACTLLLILTKGGSQRTQNHYELILRPHTVQLYSLSVLSTVLALFPPISKYTFMLWNKSFWRNIWFAVHTSFLWITALTSHKAELNQAQTLLFCKFCFRALDINLFVTSHLNFYLWKLNPWLNRKSLKIVGFCTFL